MPAETYQHHMQRWRVSQRLVSVRADLATAEDVAQDSFERLHCLHEPSHGLACVWSSVLSARKRPAAHSCSRSGRTEGSMTKVGAQ